MPNDTSGFLLPLNDIQYMYCFPGTNTPAPSLLSLLNVTYLLTSLSWSDQLLDEDALISSLCSCSSTSDLFFEDFGKRRFHKFCT